MSRRDAEYALLEVAADQSGYFTTKQALAAGYSYPAQSYHARVGDWVRASRGIYRLRGYPTQPDDAYTLLTLLSANRVGEPQAVLSHETALAIYDISDANPAKIHLTVPPKYDKDMPPQVILHRTRLTSREWESHGAYRVTTPLRTILDIAASPTGWPHLEQAIRDALRQGLIRKTQLTSVEGAKQVKEAIQSALRKIESRVVAGTPARTTAGGIALTWNTPPDDLPTTGNRAASGMKAE